VHCQQVELVSTERISDNYYRIAFDCEEIAEEARPGQFLMVRLLTASWEHLLSRPFSVCRVEGRRIELFFETLGKGTRSLSEATPGTPLEILGPLGNGFNFDAASKPILVGGGMGIAPLPFLASELAKTHRPEEITVLLGARTASSLCLKEVFNGIGVTLRTATDDGTEGHAGFVTDLLEEEVNRPGGREVAVYACGPKAMLKVVAELTEKHGVPCQMSVEERMACGVGACMSCACKTRDEEGNFHFTRVCTEGPVFDAKELVFDEN
jgi:dihydroorotate dehydrogenase electron transfer subunit